MAMASKVDIPLGNMEDPIAIDTVLGISSIGLFIQPADFLVLKFQQSGNLQNVVAVLVLV